MAKGTKKKVLDITPEVEKGKVSQQLVGYIGEKIEMIPIKDKLIEVFNPVFLSLDEWKQKVDSIDVKDGTDVQAISLAQESKNFLVKARTNLTRVVEAETKLIDQEMEPYLIKKKVWKTMLDFASSSIRAIQETAENKAKILENEKRRRIDEARAKRAQESLEYRNFLPPMVDIGTLTEEEWQQALKNAKTLYEVDKKEKDEEKAREEAEKQKTALALAHANRVRELLKEGFSEKEDEEGNLYYFVPEMTEENISDSNLKNFSDEEFEEYVKTVSNKIKKIKEKLKKDEEDKKEKDSLILKTKEFLINKGMTLNETEDSYVYKDTKIIVPIELISSMNKEELRDLMIEKSKQINSHIEAENEAKRKLEEENRQRTAKRIIELKQVTIIDGNVVYTKKDYPKEIKVIMGSIDFISSMNDEDYKVFLKEHEAKVKNDNEEYDLNVKKQQEEEERIAKAKLGDYDKLDQYATRLHELKKELIREEFSQNDVKVFVEKVIDSIAGIVERIDIKTKNK